MTPEKEDELLRRVEQLEEAVGGIANRIQQWLEFRDRIGQPPTLEGALDLLQQVCSVIQLNMIEIDNGG